MKKLFFVLAVSAALVACGGGASEAPAADSTATPAVDTTVAVDTAAAVDSAAAPVVDSAAAAK